MIRAAICETLEGSDYTSVQKRIMAIAAVHGADHSAGAASSDTTGNGSTMVAAHGADTVNGVAVEGPGLADAFLAPLEIDSRRSRDGKQRYKTKRRTRELLAV